MNFGPYAIKAMAELLADHVPELGDEAACRSWLKASGFSDRTIDQVLGDARTMARKLRGREADRLYAQWLASNGT